MSTAYSVKEAPDLQDWEAYFYSINVEWLEEFFSVTPADEDQLRHPERILQQGGSIVFLLKQEVVIGTAALVMEEGGEVQLAKMGVLKRHRGSGAGKALLQAALHRAKEMTDGMIYLETVLDLEAAIHLYEKNGFVRKGGLHTHPLFGRTTFRMELSR